MMLHLFNPENDLALAADLDNYTPPKAAVALARAGALLPMWLAEAGDAVLVADEEQMAGAEMLRERYGLDVSAVASAPEGLSGCSPWGWSRASRRRFINAGVSEAILPGDDYLNHHRVLSSRSVTIPLAERLGLVPPVEAFNFGDAMAAVRLNEERGVASYLKMPWSCSGRGVFTTAAMTREQTGRRIADIIRAQGSVIVEPDRRRVADFAALYKIEAGSAHFHALSLFATDAGGSYRGNLILPDSEIIDRLGVDPMPWAERLGEALGEIVAPVEGHGWAGVDMIVNDRGEIYPLIELNLRATMGIVAASMRRVIQSPAVLSLSAAGVEIRGV